MRLSHTISTSTWIIEFLSAALPQIKNIYAFSLYNSKGLSGHSSQGELSNKDLKKFSSFLEQANTGWYAEDETPIAFKKKLGQVGLEGELKRDYLFMRGLKSGKDELSLLIRFSPFTLSSSNYLDASEKKVAETCVKGLIQQILSQQDKDRSILKHIAYSNEQLKKEVTILQQQIERTNLSFEGTLKQLLMLLFNRLESHYEVSINYTHSFTKAVIRFTGDYQELEKHLENQVAISANLAQLTGESTIWLDESNLATFKAVARINERSKSELPMNLGRLAKAHALLDRYESAAALVSQEGLSVIGKHIGSHCSPPISNAAITDALGKNSKKIYELFERFPNKWPIIRTDFRSIANIIEKENLRRTAV